MNTKHYLVISGIIGSLLTALLVSPVTANTDKFGDIECTSLKVVDANSIALVMLSIGEHGGRINAFGKDGESLASLGIGEDGGALEITGNAGALCTCGTRRTGRGCEVQTWEVTARCEVQSS